MLYVVKIFPSLVFVSCVYTIHKSVIKFTITTNFGRYLNQKGDCTREFLVQLSRLCLKNVLHERPKFQYSSVDDYSSVNHTLTINVRRYVGSHFIRSMCSFLLPRDKEASGKICSTISSYFKWEIVLICLIRENGAFSYCRRKSSK